MAAKNQEKENKRGTILRHMTFAPEARTQPSKGAFPAGRFKMFWAIFRSNTNSLMAGNIMFLIFALPLLAVVMFITTVGMEKFSYMLSGISVIPNFMSDIGFGLSSGSSILEGKVNFLLGYRVLLLGIGITLPFLSFGFAGMMHITAKLIWGEDFISKKDSYGNNVPRAYKEFFIGVKRNWKQLLIICSVLGVCIAGFGNLIINFIQGIMLSNAGAFDWIFLFVSIIIGLPLIMVSVILIPNVALYGISFFDKIKNSAILAIALFIPTLFLVGVTLLPIWLFQMGGIIGTMMLMLFMVFGIGFLTLMWTNFAQYNAEKIVTPVYEMTLQENKKKEKKKSKK